MRVGNKLVVKKTHHYEYSLAADVGAVGKAASFSYFCLDCQGSNDLLERNLNSCQLCGSSNLIRYVEVVWDKDNEKRNGQGNGGYLVEFFSVFEEKEKKEEPKDNDGRTTCFKCGSPTKKVQGARLSLYDVCPTCKI